MRAAIANWDCFGAPAALFCYIDRNLGLPQWSDLGMYLQTVMLLLRAEGLHSCPQMAWSQVRKTVNDVLSPPDELMLFCGMSIGHEDPTVDYIRTGRAPPRRDSHVRRRLALGSDVRDYGLLTNDYGLARVRSPPMTARLRWTARTGSHQRRATERKAIEELDHDNQIRRQYVRVGTPTSPRASPVKRSHSSMFCPAELGG